MSRKFQIIIFCLLFGFSFGQEKEKLQKQTADLKKQIAAINANLAKTRSESRLSLAYLDGVNKKLQLREKVYNNTQKEKRFIEDDIYLRQLEINRQNRELKVLRSNYAKVLVNAYKNKGIQNKVTFILSSQSIGQALRRIKYLQLYSEYQDKKAAEISDAAKLLKASVTEKQKSMKQKEILLVNQQTELSTINAERLQKEKLLADFKKNETRLVAEINQKQKQQKALEGRIRALINEELRASAAKEEARKKEEAEKIRLAKESAAREKAKIDAENKAKALALEKERLRAEAEAKKAADALAKKEAEERKRNEAAAKAEATEKEEARKIAAAKEAAEARAKSKAADEKLAEAKAAETALENKKDAEKKAAETKALTNFGVSPAAAGANFASYRGQMSMPVRGTITHRFGRQPHPVLKNIVEDNLGIKIATAKGSVAKCIFPGEVSEIMDSGDGTLAIVVKHGSYFSIYSNMKSSSVSRGSKTSAGSPLGIVAEDFDGTTTIDFQIWSGKNPVNPLDWVN